MRPYSFGPSPAKTKLDPRKSYQVLFEKPGYVSVNKPIIFGGSTEEKLVVNLEWDGLRELSDLSGNRLDELAVDEEPELLRCDRHRRLRIRVWRLSTPPRVLRKLR